jgi:bifunctional pyridoxal-dependent enzyme with beta-cystathionase and maltose regulon repressor activities
VGNGFEDLDLDRLRRRRSEKWRAHPPDVLPAFIAEMDYDLAEPARAFLRRGRVALGRGLDFGAPGDGFVRVTIGTSSALLAEIVDRMAAAVGG